ncbi:MAG: hypothetical protein ABH879_02280 [archaeon]
MTCFCRTLEIFAPESGWAEDTGTTVCWKNESRPDISIMDLNIRPSKSVSVGEDVFFDLSIKNIGTAGCSQVVVDFDFGDDIAERITSSWCTHYGYTPEECEAMGAEPYFMPGQDYAVTPANLYSAPANYTISMEIFCAEAELGYANNDFSSQVYVH